MRPTSACTGSSLIMAIVWWSSEAFTPTSLNPVSSGIQLKGTSYGFSPTAPTNYGYLEERQSKRTTSLLFAEGANKSAEDDEDPVAQAERAIKEASAAIEAADRTLSSRAPEIPVKRVARDLPKTEAPKPPASINESKDVAQPRPPPPPPSPPKKQPSSDIIGQAVAAAVGGVALGGALGFIADYTVFQDAALSSDEMLIPPVALGCFLGVTSFVAAANEESGVGKLVRGALGGPVVGLGNGIKGAIVAVILGIKNRIVAIPGEVTSFVKDKIDDTVEEVKAVPTKVKVAAEKKIDETKKAAQDAVTNAVEEVKAVPSKVKTATVKKIDETVAEVKAVPTKVKEGVTKAVEEAKEEVKKTVEGITGEITSKVEAVIPLPEKPTGETIISESPQAPKPPVIPPPPVESRAPVEEKSKSFSILSEQVAPPKTVEKISPLEKLPQVDSPTIEFPKIALPKVELPKLEFPKVDLPIASDAKEKESDFVFSELSLKDFVKDIKEEASIDEDDAARAAKEKSEREAKAAKEKAEREAKALAAKQAQEASRRELEAKKQRLEAERNAKLEAARVAEEKRKDEAERKTKAAAVEADRAERQKMAEQARQAKVAEDAVRKAKPGVTIRLFGLFGGDDEDEDDLPSPTSVKAPAGVPTLSRWRVNGDGSLSGVIKGSRLYNDGEAITTSPIKGEAVGGSVVVTGSGSKYFLEEKAKGFSLFGGASSVAPAPVAGPSPAALAAEERQRKADEAREAAEERKRQAEIDRIAKIEAARAAVEERKQQAELERRSKIEAAERLRRANEEARAKAEAARKAAEAKRQAAADARAQAEAARVEAEERKRKASEEMQVKAEAARLALEERKRQAEEERLAKIEAARLAAEEREKKRVSEAAAKKAAQAAKSAMSQAKPNATIRLFGLFGGDEEDDKENVSPANAAAKLNVAAPRGVPVLSKWKQNRDGSISGLIKGSPLYEDGEAVTTSPIRGDAVGGSVVVTGSGSKYFLEEKSTGFSLFGGLKTAPPPAQSKAPATEDKSRQLEERKKQLEADKKAQIEAAQKAAEERKAKLEQDRFERIRAAEERKEQLEQERQEKLKAAQKAAEERRLKAEKDRQDKIQAVQEQAEARKRQIEQQKQAQASSAAARAAAEERERQAKAARQVVQEAKPGATVRLFSLFGGDDEAEPVAPARKASSGAPRGVPTLSRWKQNSDGSVTGRISGSPNYSDGESVTTSPIKGEVVGGTVVITGSGSKYFLEEKAAGFSLFGGGGVAADSKEDQRARIARDKAAEEKRQSSEEKRKAVMASAEEKKRKAEDAARSAQELRKKLEMEQLAKAEAARKAADAKVRQATVQRTPTISLFNINAAPAERLPPPPKKEALKVAPRNVPKLVRWKQNRDGSISGFISGSRAFSEGEYITTSPIISGSAEAGEVVQTGSGSKYYLV